MKTFVIPPEPEDIARTEFLKEQKAFYEEIRAHFAKPSADARLQTAMNAMGDALYAISGGDAQHAVTILRDTLERLNQN